MWITNGRARTMRARTMRARTMRARTMRARTMRARTMRARTMRARTMRGQIARPQGQAGYLPRSARMRLAALWPAAPMTDPAGWQPAEPA